MNKRRVYRVTAGKAAAAMRYKQGEDIAPRLVAKGSGIIAEKIIEAAKEAGVPIHESPDLVALLMTLNVGEMIGPEMYSTIAEVLAFIYRLNGKAVEQPE